MNIIKDNIEFQVVETELNKNFWIEHYNCWEIGTFDFLKKYANKNKVMIDIGSWIGPISLPLSYYFKKCICFEPDKFAYDEFVSNIKINK